MASGMVWATVKGSSPVPGGESMIKKSRSLHSISEINCLITPILRGPLQIVATSFFSPIRDSMEITSMFGIYLTGPAFPGMAPGSMVPFNPNKRGMLGP